MDFAKFAAMLVNGGLYLSRLDQLGDAYEGYIPDLPREAYEGILAQQHFERDQELRKRYLGIRKQFYVNCWHANKEQSDAMWKLYTRGAEGVAIRTTCRKLCASLQTASQDLLLFEVAYADLEEGPTHGGSMLRACMTKRTPFEHEKEVRLICHHGQSNDNQQDIRQQTFGFYVNCDLATLIDCVYIAPTETPWFEPIVQDILHKYGIDTEVCQSTLQFEPA